MTLFNEGFYTTDYDQEMLDYVENNYKVYKPNGWSFNKKLCYHTVDQDFYVTKYYPCGGGALTKEQFKQKIGMPSEKKTPVEKRNVAEK